MIYQFFGASWGSVYLRIVGGFKEGTDSAYSLLTSTLREAFIPEGNLPLTIFRLPGNPTLSRSFMNAFTGDFARFEAQLRQNTAIF